MHVLEVLQGGDDEAAAGAEGEGDAVLEALLVDAIAVIDAPLAAMSRLPQHARQATSTAMHSLLLDLRTERGLATSADQDSQAHVAAVPTEDQQGEVGTTVATRLVAEAQATARAREAQAEAQRLNKQTQEIRAAHTETIRAHVAAYSPIESTGDRLEDAVSTSWSLLLGHEPGAEESGMDAAASAAAQAVEEAIFKRVEAEMTRYGIVDKVRAAADAAAWDTPDMTEVTARPSAEQAAVEGDRASSDQRHESEGAVEDEGIDSLLQQLRVQEDPQEIARRAEEEVRLEYIRGLEHRLGSSDLQELFALEMILLCNVLCHFLGLHTGFPTVVATRCH